MKKVTSKDGTTIAFDQLGDGPALILVSGAFQTLEGQGHDVALEVLAPVLIGFFEG